MIRKIGPKDELVVITSLGIVFRCGWLRVNRIIVFGLVDCIMLVGRAVGEFKIVMVRFAVMSLFKTNKRSSKQQTLL